MMGNQQINNCDEVQNQRRKYTKTPAGIVARVRPRRTIVRGGSRVTRGKRSVFPERSERYLTLHFISTTRIKNNNSLRWDEYSQWFSMGRAVRSPSPNVYEGCL